MGVVNKLVVFAVQSTERSWMTGATKPAPSVGDPGTMIMSVRHVARSSVCCATSAITTPPGFPYTWSTVRGKGREQNRWALAMKREETLRTLCEIQWNFNEFLLSKIRLWKRPWKICKPKLFSRYENCLICVSMIYA